MNLIVGGDSVIGRAIASVWDRAGVKYLLSTRRKEQVSAKCLYVDLAHQDWDELDGKGFDAVVFCAAITKLSTCEDNPEYSRRVNVTSTSRLAEFLSKRSKYLLFLSSNQVFDGSMPNRQCSDAVCPINEYGRQKVDAEKGFFQIPNAAVLRLTKVIHPQWLLLKQWGDELMKQCPIEVYGDMFLAPVSIEAAVNKINTLCDACVPGLHHLPSGKDISYYDFVSRHFAGLQGVEGLIHKVSAPKARLYPRYTSLI